MVAGPIPTSGSVQGRTERDAGDIGRRPLECKPGRADRGDARAEAVPRHHHVEGFQAT